MKICNKCNAQLDDAAAFCTNCGASFAQQPQQPYSAPQQPYGAAPQQPYGAAPQQPYGAAPQQPYGAAPQQQAYYQQPYGVAPQQPRVSGLATAAKILMIVSTVIMGLYIIPLAWCLPMVISYNNKLKNNQPISTAFKICTLLFVNTIAGILMLCDKDQK